MLLISFVHSVQQKSEPEDSIRMQTAAKTVLFLFLLMAGIAALGIYWTFYLPLPDYESTHSLPGLERPVDIYWDTFGVPHIYADDKRDLYYAVGYVHAQDRLWQMTLSQMAAEGRFAEFLGKDLLPYDRLQRTLGFWRIATRLEETLSDEMRSYLQAYADGVNSYVQQNRESLPIAFSLADMDPIPWSVTHSIAIARLMAWELNIPWKVEPVNAMLYQKLGQDKFRELFPNENLYSATPRQDSHLDYAEVFSPLMSYSRQLDDLLQVQGNMRGSNAWAVDSSRTHTGYPLLAGDPHLGLNIPGKWYEVHLNQNGRNLSGATIPGAPFVILGQNDRHAWSLTNIMLDDTDFYEEAVHPEDPGRYVLDSLAGEPVYEEFQQQRELIRIKNSDDTTFTRRLTKHGPVISGVYPQQSTVEDRVVTMAWTGYELSKEFTAIERMGWADSFEEFQQAARAFKVPGQNVIYADKDGNIARYALANIPLRDGNPLVIRKGWEPELDWQGFLPFERLPHEVNPERGWLANANNPIGTSGESIYISSYWHTDNRYRRIARYLEESDIITSEIFQVMQSDTYSMFAADMTARILPILTANREEDPHFDTAISYLRNWDYTYSPSETAASIMDVFVYTFTRKVLEDEMGSDLYEGFIAFTGQPYSVISRFMQDGSTFFNNIQSPVEETLEDQVVASMAESLDYLEERYGADPIEWRWENLHTLTLSPPLFGQAAKDPEAPSTLKLIVNNIFNKGPLPVGGHSLSINNGEYQWTDPYHMVLGPSIRRIIDFSDLSSTLSILPTGQSGNPLSEYYGDQTESWLNGQYKFLYQDSTFFNENLYRTMRLLPEE